MIDHVETNRALSGSEERAEARASTRPGSAPRAAGCSYANRGNS